MKQLAFMFVCTCTCIFSFTQEQVLFKIYYNFSHVRDTTIRDKAYSERMVLEVSKNASLYNSASLTEADSLEKKIISDLSSKSQLGDFQRLLDLSAKKKITKERIYIDRVKQRKEYVLFQNFNKVDYSWKEEIPPIQWQIKEDTKLIKGLICQRATARFRGRDYDAWFCTELSYDVGPWKFSGLPGVILEIYDLKKEVVFTLDKIEDNKNNNVIIQLPKGFITTTRKQYELMVKSYREALHTGGVDGISFTVTGVNKVSPSGVPNFTNNPIELTKE